MKSCRICFEDEDGRDYISPCLCKGSSKWIHRECLELCMKKAFHFKSCPVCEFKYEFEYSGNYVVDYMKVAIYSLYLVMMASASIIFVVVVMPSALTWLVIYNLELEVCAFEAFMELCYVVLCVVGVWFVYKFISYRTILLVQLLIFTLQLVYNFGDWVGLFYDVLRTFFVYGSFLTVLLISFVSQKMSKHAYTLVYAKIIVDKIKVIDQNSKIF